MRYSSVVTVGIVDEEVRASLEFNVLGTMEETLRVDAKAEGESFITIEVFGTVRWFGFAKETRKSIGSRKRRTRSKGDQNLGTSSEDGQIKSKWREYE